MIKTMKTADMGMISHSSFVCMMDGFCSSTQTVCA